MSGAASTRASAAAIIGVALLGAVCLNAQQPATVGLLVAPFAGKQPLASQTATVLLLQIWQTLRLAPTPNPQNLSFGRGLVQWANWTPPTLHSQAIEQLSGTGSQMVLWGRVESLGKGVVIQAYLSVAPNVGPAAGDIWRLELPDIGARRTIGVGLPETMYQFAPIVLRLDLIPLLNSQIGVSPANVPVYRDRAFTQRIGVLGENFQALEQGRDYARVRTDAIPDGFISIPGLSVTRTEVGDFSGGLIRVYRKDWGGAIDLLTQVVNDQAQPVSIRVSSYLLMAAASRQLSDETGAPDRSLEFTEAAERLNPYLRDTIKYKCMALIARRAQPDAIRQLDATLQASSYLFPKDDPWLATVRTVVQRHQR